MADATSLTSKPKKPLQEIPSNDPKPSKFFSHFLYKATFITVFLVLLPLFPYQAPEFISQYLNDNSWELLQLILVGIAVSYGLFSKRNDESGKDQSFGNAQSYVSKLLQVSSVFDDESENPTVIDDNKVETWSSQYRRGENVLAVAKESPVAKDAKSVTLGTSQKPLLLPVRSLKQRVSEPNELNLVNDIGGQNGGVDRLSSNSKRFSASVSKPRIGDFGGMNSQKLDNRTEENVVLRSPIPWRSRSGRMEVEENGDSPEMNRLEIRSSLSPSSSSKSLSPSQSLSSPRQKPSKLASFSSESQAKSSEDVVRKKNISLAPPPPPPPPPQFLRKSVMMRSNSTVVDNAVSYEKEFKRSARSMPTEELDDSEMDFGIDLKSRVQNDGSQYGRSVRTFRSSETEKISTGYEMKFIAKKGYEGTRMSKEIPNAAMQTYVKFTNATENELAEKVLMEVTDDEVSECWSEDDHFESSPRNGQTVNNDIGNDSGPDVDKKADEFIAKFREQIRLQRIDSIRRSTAQRVGKTFVNER